MKFGLLSSLLWRDWRGGELGLLLTALVVAVATVVTISLFVDRLQSALVAESSNILGADRLITGSLPLPEDFGTAATELGLNRSSTVTFSSMVYSGSGADSTSQLVSVKAVEDSYPLRGTMKVSIEAFGAVQVLSHGPKRGEVWMDSRLFPALGLVPGDSVAVGEADFVARLAIIQEPGRGTSFVDLAPRLMMHIDDISSTRVIQPGSRIFYALLLSGNEAELDELELRLEDQLKPRYRWRSVRDTAPSIGSSLDRAESFLLLGGLLSVLLAGTAVALSARRYALRHFDHVAILKTLGATPSQIQWGFVALLALLGIVATLLGLVLGGGLHFAVLFALQSFLPAELPAPGLHPFVLGSVTGFICLFSFALPPVFDLKQISPMRVIRRDLDVSVRSKVLSYGFAAAGSLILLVWYSGSLKLTVYSLAGMTAVVVVFGSLATLLLRSTSIVGTRASSYGRLAFANLRRRYQENVVQILIFSIAIMMLLILVLLRTALIDEWRSQVPENAPDHFVMNIAEQEVGAVQKLLEENTHYEGQLFPMTRGRVTHVNDLSAEEWQEQNRGEDGIGPRLRGERNLSWTYELPLNNEIVSGEWWGGDTGEIEKLVSLEQGYAESAKLSVGDVLQLDVGGVPVSAMVSSIRKVNWESMQPNFFILFSPAMMENISTTYMTSFHLGAQGKQFLNVLLGQFRTLSVLEVDRVIQQIQNIVDRVSQAIELILALVLTSGALVLIASIQAGSDERLREHALLRTLGGSKLLIRGALLIEFMVLGFVAGLIATIGAELSVALLQTQVFELDAQLHPWLWIVGPLAGLVAVSLVGMFGTRHLVASPPIMVLRELGKA